MRKATLILIPAVLMLTFSGSGGSPHEAAIQKQIMLTNLLAAVVERGWGPGR